MKSSKIAQMCIESCLRDDILRSRQISLSAEKQSEPDFERNDESINQSLNSAGVQLIPKIVCESLIEV
jgi:hypothetical protein